MPSLRVICLVGRSGVGKDTVGDILKLHHGYFKIAQADAIRSAFNDINGQGWDLRKDYDGTRNPIIIPIRESSREIIKTIGTDCVDNVTTWTRICLAKIRYLNFYHINKFDKFVITDVRFPSQLNLIIDFVRAYQGEWRSIKIVRNGVMQSSHITESATDEVPYDDEIPNNGTIANLCSHVRSFIDRENGEF